MLALRVRVSKLSTYALSKSSRYDFRLEGG